MDCIKEIKVRDIGQYTVQSRSCKISSICQIDAQQGFLSLDLSSFTGIERCSFHIRRKTGNGRAVLLCGSKASDITVLSKISNVFSIDCDGKEHVCIKRTNLSSGIIELIGVSLYGSAKEIQSSGALKGELEKAIMYENLSFIEDDLFATKRSYIKTYGLVNIVTDPPNAVTVNNNNIRFTKDCQILSLTMCGKGISLADYSSKSSWKFVDIKHNLIQKTTHEPSDRVVDIKYNNSVKYSNLDLSDPILENVKKNSILTFEKSIYDNKFSVNGVVGLCSYNSVQWFNKIRFVIKDLKFSNPYITDVEKSNNLPALAMCNCLNITTDSNRIFIEELHNKDLVVNGNKDYIKDVYTPSIHNFVLLKNYFPKARINLIGRLWPSLDLDVPLEDHSIYFETNHIITKSLINNWDSSFGKLKIIGSNVLGPNADIPKNKMEYIENISGYDSYENIMRLMFSSKMLISLNINRQYISGILELSKYHNIPFITNNSEYLSFSDYFVPTDRYCSNLNMVNKRIKSLLNNKKTESRINKNYNKNILVENVKELVNGT